MPTQLLNKSQLMQHLNVSEKTYQTLLNEGLPVAEKKGRAYKFDAEAVDAFVIERETKKGKSEAYADARARKEAAAATLMEMELAERQGALITTEAAAQRMVEEYTRVRTRMLTIANKISGILLGMQSQIEIQLTIEEHIRDALSELSEVDPQD